MINAEAVIKVPKFARDMYRDLYNDYNKDFRHTMDIDYYILRKIIKQKDISKLNDKDIIIKLAIEVSNEI